MSLPFTPMLAFAAAPLNSNVFMLIMVLAAATAAAAIAFNVVSLKHRSTNKACVFSVVALLFGILVSGAAFGKTYQTGASSLLDTVPGRIALGCDAMALSLAIFGVIQAYWMDHRYRRGRKRGIAVILGSLAFGALLLSSSYFAKGLGSPRPARTSTELLPDAWPDYRATPTPAPVPATPIPTPPPPAATPRTSLFPTTITPQ